MALINCPECNKPVSDKAKTCPHCGIDLEKEVSLKFTCPECGQKVSGEYDICPICGFPLKKGEVLAEEKVQIIPNTIQITNSSLTYKKKKFFIVSFVALILSAIIIFITATASKQKEEKYNKALALIDDLQFQEAASLLLDLKGYKDVNKLLVYNEAMSWLEKGNYEKAKELFNPINGYRNVDEAQEQIVYESCVLSCISGIKNDFYNPDSLYIHDVIFNLNTEEKDDASPVDNKKSIYPPCVIELGGQNQIGGKAIRYYLFYYSEEEKKYNCLGSCKSLDEDDYKEEYKKDDDYLMEKFIYLLITTIIDDQTEYGNINLNRLNNLLKTNVYTPINFD